MAVRVLLPARPCLLFAASLVAGLVQAAALEIDVTDAAGTPLPDAVVFLESPEARRLVKPLVGAEIVQDGRQFLPAVMVVPKGTEVLFPNRDKVRHHVYSFSPAKKFEIKLYSGTHSNPVHFDQPGVVVLGCNIHDRMVAWVVVVDTPYFAQSDAVAGKARIDGVPPGRYTLRTWHARLPIGAPALEQALVVGASAVSQASVRVTGLQP